jgi:hypothetical protein
VSCHRSHTPVLPSACPEAQIFPLTGAGIPIPTREEINARPARMTPLLIKSLPHPSHSLRRVVGPSRCHHLQRGLIATGWNSRWRVRHRDLTRCLLHKLLSLLLIFFKKTFFKKDRNLVMLIGFVG